MMSGNSRRGINKAHNWHKCWYRYVVGKQVMAISTLCSSQVDLEFLKLFQIYGWDGNCFGKPTYGQNKTNFLSKVTTPLLKFELSEKHTKFEKNLPHGLDVYYQ